MFGHQDPDRLKPFPPFVAEKSDPALVAEAAIGSGGGDWSRQAAIAFAGLAAV